MYIKNQDKHSLLPFSPPSSLLPSTSFLASPLHPCHVTINVTSWPAFPGPSKKMVKVVVAVTSLAVPVQNTKTAKRERFFPRSSLLSLSLALSLSPLFLSPSPSRALPHSLSLLSLSLSHSLSLSDLFRRAHVRANIHTYNSGSSWRRLRWSGLMRGTCRGSRSMSSIETHVAAPSSCVIT